MSAADKFLDAYEQYADARNKARREQSRELQLLVATAMPDGLSLRAVVDGNELNFHASRDVAASIIEHLAKALAEQNEH